MAAGAKSPSFAALSRESSDRSFVAHTKGNTIHKLLEFAPIWFDIEDPENPGEFKKTMRFVPQRTRYNPLPYSLEKIVIEESSMVDTSLFRLLMDACPHKPQIILLGDIHQLPPFEGESILGYALCDWQLIELKRIYR